MNRCSYIPSWPFVACPQKRQQIGQNCEKCLRITYAFILRNGIPLQCNPCFNAYGRTNFNAAYMYAPYPQFGWYPPMGPGPEMDPPIIDNEIEFDINNDWKEDRTKCILPDGNISDDCIESDGSGSDKPVTYSPENDYQYDYDNDENLTYDRRRRQTFSRSKYSRRYRHLQN